MRLFGPLSFRNVFAAGLLLTAAAPRFLAQTCTTQARLTPALRDTIVSAGLSLATAVQAGDAARVRSSTVAEYASDFSGSEFLIHSTATRVGGEALAVTSVYALDASSVKPGTPGNVEFSCPLAGLPSETDFSVPGLPPGSYAFVTVEATGGARPWLLSFLLRDTAGKWQMAGFYPHPRTAVSHDGLWYWNAARAANTAKHPWASWLEYSEADALLRPANFVTSSNLDKLRTEQHSAAPPELSSGVSAETPLVLTGPAGEFHFTSLTADPSDDGSRLNIILHLRVDSIGEPKSATPRNLAAATAFVDAHPEVRSAFTGVWVYAEAAGAPPFATEYRMSDLH